MHIYVRLFLSTLLLTLTLAFSAFAGNGHCPDAPPPPSEEGRSATPETIDSNIFDSLLKELWELIASDLDQVM